MQLSRIICTEGRQAIDYIIADKDGIVETKSGKTFERNGDIITEVLSKGDNNDNPEYHPSALSTHSG
jgi:hypothetical protein